ncbi:hypothetical protein ACO1O0_004521 [Amphichorda felina]
MVLHSLTGDWLFESTVIGGFCLQPAQLYPHLRFVLQDHAPAIERAKVEVWPRESPDALASGRIQFIAHDYFDKNPMEGAGVHWLRYVLHDWSDGYCVRILSRIPHLDLRDLAMMAIINGIERKLYDLGAWQNGLGSV